MRKTTVKTALLKRLKRVEGQVVGLSRMVEEERYCVDILMQIRAAEAALHGAGEMLLKDHLETCVRCAFESRDAADRAARIEELVRIYSGLRAK